MSCHFVQLAPGDLICRHAGGRGAGRRRNRLEARSVEGLDPLVVTIG
ncbi:MAG: hypothetical protein IPI02_06510 [Sterolibacteriaceae bacterium]|nr:hypothetical protein [Sterolibacteriaceae bacterium]